MIHECSENCDGLGGIGKMNNEFEPSIEEALEEINKIAKKMKEAKERGDKIGYEFALKEHERLHKKYAHILYKKRKSTQVFYKSL